MSVALERLRYRALGDESHETPTTWGRIDDLHGQVVGDHDRAPRLQLAARPHERLPQIGVVPFRRGPYEKDLGRRPSRLPPQEASRQDLALVED